MITVADAAAGGSKNVTAKRKNPNVTRYWNGKHGITK